MTEPRDDDLRALLEDAVSDVEPRPALHRIQSRTQTKVVPMNSKRPWILAALGAVAATAATLVAVTVITDDDPVTTAGPATSPSATATPEGDDSDDPTSDPDDEATSDPDQSLSGGETVTVPVYYVGETPAGTRLFREFHRVEKDSNDSAQVRIALTEALANSAMDPDYRSDWPAGASLVGVSIDGLDADDMVWIDLADPALRDRPAGMSQEQAELAVQQLIHTAQAVLQQRQPVQLLIDGEPTDTVLGVPTGGPLTAGDPMAVQASVWVTSPQEGDTVDRTFVVDGRGIFFEANVSWQLLQDGEVVKDGFTTAEDGMSLASYSFEVTAEPGDYVLRVYDADMSGGEGDGSGGGEAEDSKAITVE